MKTFDFRLTPSKQDVKEWDTAAIKRVFKNWFKRWCFQIECGKATKKFHIQARLSVKVKDSTRNAVVEKLKVLWAEDEGASWYVKPTSENAMGSNLYVMKMDTRVEGPWSDRDGGGYVQKRFRDPTLLPWQERLLKLIKKHQEECNDRNIICVSEPNGRIGKSYFKGYCKSHFGAKIIPATMADGGDMVRCLMAQVEEGDEKVHVVMVDVPRATAPKHWFALARGLETLKQGFLYDERNSWKECTIEPPVVVCFMNDPPPHGCMSSDVFEFFNVE